MSLKTSAGESGKPYNVVDLEVLYKEGESCLPLLVVGSEIPTLIGRICLQKVQLWWRAMFPLIKEEIPMKLKKIQAKFDSMFNEEFSCLKDF